ncbi:hypothetical protein P8452_23042 [Trifolium repens]|nr:hypothetical protein P8452_23042 [Trifolium repens]
MDNISQVLQEMTMGEPEPKPFKEIAKKEKVCSTKESYSQLCQMYTPQELCRLYTPDELRHMLTSDELVQMFTPSELREMFTDELPKILRADQLVLMRFPKPKLKRKVTKASFS